MKEKISMQHTQQTGAVSLFIVVFSALLMTIVTVSFVTLMVTNQQQSSANDLSDSALDSAQSGVEDAKRALLQYQQLCTGANLVTNAQECSTIANTDMTSCNGVFQDGHLTIPGIQTNSDGSVTVGSDSGYNQAYTCVEILLNTPTYVGVLDANQSALVPLAAADPSSGNQVSFDTVEIQWYTKADLQSTTGSSAVAVTGASPTSPALLSQSKWPLNEPSIMRAQLMQFDSAGGFTLGSSSPTEPGFDGNDSTDQQSNTGTVFLYPTSTSAKTTASLYTPRGTNEGSTGTTPQNTSCVTSLAGTIYACTEFLTLPEPVNYKSTDTPGDIVRFLNIDALYNATHYSISLLSSGTPVDFDGVQPEIDSTGRADDVYRRVDSHVNYADNSFPYPDATVAISGNLCKDFIVSTTAPDLPADSTGCTP
jgi:Tfp pilus assembly protein PilX